MSSQRSRKASQHLKYKPLLFSRPSKRSSCTSDIPELADMLHSEKPVSSRFLKQRLSLNRTPKLPSHLFPFSHRKTKLSKECVGTSLKNEIKILQALNHPNVAKIIGLFKTSNHLHVWFELVQGNSLSCSYGPGFLLPEPKAKEVFRQIVGAVNYCHSKGVSHRTINLNNIIIDSSLKITLVNFKNAILATECWSMTEEQIIAGPAKDIWDLGKILFWLVTGELPFETRKGELSTGEILKHGLAIPFFISKTLRHLIRLMLTEDPLDRPRAIDVLNHQWLDL